MLLGRTKSFPKTLDNMKVKRMGWAISPTRADDGFLKRMTIDCLMTILNKKRLRQISEKSKSFGL
jgi:hypothetical protein